MPWPSYPSLLTLFPFIPTTDTTQPCCLTLPTTADHRRRPTPSPPSHTPPHPAPFTFFSLPSPPRPSPVPAGTLSPPLPVADFGDLLRPPSPTLPLTFLTPSQPHPSNAQRLQKRSRRSGLLPRRSAPPSAIAHHRRLSHPLLVPMMTSIAPIPSPIENPSFGSLAQADHLPYRRRLVPPPVIATASCFRRRLPATTLAQALLA